MKLKLSAWFALVLLGLTCLVLAQIKPRPEPAAAAPPAGAKTISGTNTEPVGLSVVGYIETRDRTITIKAGPKGRVYSVKSHDGKVLCENLSVEQARAQAPELADFIKSAVAGDSTTRPTDARLNSAMR